MHRLAWLFILVSGVAFAGPQGKPIRKPAPADLDADSIESIVDAIMLDKAGDYDGAISRYQRTSLKDIPAAVYNIADLRRRAEDYDRAIEAYKKYLELAPNAPDRAAVQKLIDQLARTPQTIVVDGDDFDGVVFIDGKPAGPSPLVTTLPDGDHIVERIGPTTYIHRRVRAQPLRTDHITAYNEASGNVVLSSSEPYSGSWNDGDKRIQMHARFTLPRGRIDTYYFQPGRACSPLSFEVPADGLVYVFVQVSETKRSGCTPIKVTAQKLQFAAVKK